MRWDNPTPGLFIDEKQRVRVRAVCGDDGFPQWMVEERSGQDWNSIRPFTLPNDALEWARLSYGVKAPKESDEA